MATDRELLKLQQKGQFGTNNAASTPLTEVENMHKRQRDINKVGTENAATNVAETAGFVLVRKGWLKAASLLQGANVAANNTDYTLITLSKRTSAGASQTTVATLNTSSAGQGAITQYVPLAFALGTASNLIIAAGSVITYTITKGGAGKVIDPGCVFSLDIEEV